MPVTNLFTNEGQLVNTPQASNRVGVTNLFAGYKADKQPIQEVQAPAKGFNIGDIISKVQQTASTALKTVETAFTQLSNGLKLSLTPTKMISPIPESKPVEIPTVTNFTLGQKQLTSTQLGQIQPDFGVQLPSSATLKQPLPDVFKSIKNNAQLLNTDLGKILYKIFEPVTEENVLNPELEKQKKENEEKFNHSYYQGLLLEIGNLKGYKTYIPPQDKNKLFLEKSLGSISKVDTMLEFSYPEIIERS